MKCLDFQQLALSDPNSDDPEFLVHKAECPNCQQFLLEVQQMDHDLSKSLDVQVPDELIARLKLTQNVSQEKQQRQWRPYAIAASVAMVFLVAGLLITNQWMFQQQQNADYLTLIDGVIEHVESHPESPVWSPVKANRDVGILMASYNDSLKFNYLKSLQFGKICPMGKYKGLHATMETPSGQVTFAYFKGEPISKVSTVSYKGYVTLTKPVKDGNLVIISRNRQSVMQAETQLKKVMQWQI